MSGFRCDAVPFLIELNGIDRGPLGRPAPLPQGPAGVRQRRQGDAILLGEVNLPPKQQREFFGDEDGDELNLVFNFSVMQRIYLALARGDARPVEKALADLPDVPFDSQWATFLRNHDELTLDQLTDREREEVFAAFGPEPDMQVYGRGLRRRLPPMLDGEDQRIRMAYSLLFSLPGTPVLFYGEEIGMGENLASWPAARRCARPCSGPPSREPGSRPRRPAGSRPRWWTGVRAAGGQRRRPAPGPGVAAQLVRAADPEAHGRPPSSASVPGRSSPPMPGRSWPTAATGGTRRWWRSTTSRPSRAGWRAAGGHRRPGVGGRPARRDGGSGP